MRFSRPPEPVERFGSHPRSGTVDTGELRRVIRLCSTSIGVRAPITFVAGQPVRATWERWSADIFHPVLLPRFLKAIDFARREQARDLLLVDAELTTELLPARASASVSIGRKNLEQLRVAKGIPWVHRYETGVLQHSDRGHFAITHAIACGLFNVGTWNAILSLLCEEYSAAFGLLPWELPLESPEFALLLDPEPLRAAVNTLESSAARFHVA